MGKKFYVENLGCAKNQVDAEVMIHNLKSNGWDHVEEVEKADLIIVNTCGFIESAREESINTFFSLKEANPKGKIILGGCLAQRYSEDLVENLPEAHGIFGNRDLSTISDFVNEIFTKDEGKTQASVPDFPKPEDEINSRSFLYNYPGSAYLKISEGCNHWCGYCAIPLIRGSLRSRPMDSIVEEAKNLVSKGIKEINLVAQDLAAYGMDWDKKSHFLELLHSLTAIEGNFIIRMLYIHPDAFPKEILPFIKNNSKVIPYFDIPFQHSSPKILRPMKRSGDSESYYNLVKTIREFLPDAVIRTTIMLGFPGDTKEDFDNVYNFVKKCEFNWMGCFTYSREEGTDAYNLTNEEEHEVLIKKAKTWEKKLQKLQEKITEKKLQDFVGKEYDVLIEELVEQEDLAIGRIYCQAPEVDGLTVVMGRDMIPGNVYRCGITKVNGIDLEAVKL
ncbi:MAG: 30S ribosomal protein S12 methylthiotransferase RimO [Sphaerochaetaceae bacterium]|nr:30S ribosomal protein S12 methylthiotransferase RimO [Sphaerochaetaceae bacterium]